MALKVLPFDNKDVNKVISRLVELQPQIGEMVVFFKLKGGETAKLVTTKVASTWEWLGIVQQLSHDYFLHGEGDDLD